MVAQELQASWVNIAPVVQPFSKSTKLTPSTPRQLPLTWSWIPENVDIDTVGRCDAGDTWMLDLLKNAWVMLESSTGPVVHEAAVAAITSSKAILFGGMTGGDLNPNSATYEFDFLTGWTPGTDGESV